MKVSLGNEFQVTLNPTTLCNVWLNCGLKCIYHQTITVLPV